MKKYIKRFITFLFFKYCYRESDLATYMQVYFVPNTVKKLKKDGVDLVDGQFLFAQLETVFNDNMDAKCKFNPIVDVKFFRGIS